MVKITDHHDMTSTVYRGRKARTINIMLITGSSSENWCAHAHFRFIALSNITLHRWRENLAIVELLTNKLASFKKGIQCAGRQNFAILIVDLES